MPDLDYVQFQGGEVPLALCINGEHAGWMVYKIDGEWRPLKECGLADRQNILAPVEMEVSLKFHYKAKPEYYGTNNAEEMAKIDHEQCDLAELIAGQFGGEAARKAEIVIKPRGFKR